MVFKTIAENVKSFFQREESLEQQPKKTKDAAIELFEKPSAEHRIVSHQLKPAPHEAPPVQKPLPFSAEQLRQRLAAQQASAPPVRAPQRAPQIITDDEISSQIVEFERAITTIPGEDGSTLPLSTPPERLPERRGRPASSAASRRNDGYFDELARYLREQGYAVDDVQLEHALTGMRSHHEYLLANEQHQERGRGLEDALTQKLAELQELERDWASKHEEIHAARRRVTELEEAIAKRTGELKGLVSTMKVHTTQAPAPVARPVLPPAAPAVVPMSMPAPVAPATQPVAALPPLPVATPVSPSMLTTPPVPPSSPSPSSLPLSSPIAPITPVTAPVPAPVPVLAPVVASSVSIPASVTSLSSVPVAPPGQRFFLKDGRSLSTLAELRTALLAMDDATYYHHVSPQRNDFSSWIRDVFQDGALAARVEHARTRYDLLSILPA